ncbi:MAG: hypothetical protein AAF327_24795 [Cyanobacteria bacterium P01_A01_bin.37]
MHSSNVAGAGLDNHQRVMVHDLATFSKLQQGEHTTVNPWRNR